MSDIARDVVRYIKSMENTDGFRTVWIHDRGSYSCLVEETADGFKARQLDLIEQFGSLAAANLAAAAKWLSRYSDGKWGTFRSSGYTHIEMRPRDDCSA